MYIKSTMKNVAYFAKKHLSEFRKNLCQLQCGQNYKTGHLRAVAAASCCNLMAAF